MRNPYPQCPVPSLSSMKANLSSKYNVTGIGIFPIIFVAISLAAIAASFVLANSVQDYGIKSRGFSAIIVVYLSVCFAVHFLSFRSLADRSIASFDQSAEDRIDEQLKGIEEAGEYFRGSLKSGDVFRLVSSRANQLLPFTGSALFVVDKAVRSFKSVHAQGENAEKLTNIETPLDAGLAGRCFESRMVQIERGVSGFNELIPVEALSGFRSAAAIPLVRSGEVFAVITLYSDSRTAFDGSAITTLEAIGERIAPLVLSSLSFEQSLSNALTDPVTHLPNERAFHLILENQIAETQRNPENRPLTVLALDIREFDQFNLKYGHVAGDRVLSLVANTVKSQLRQMDFFARASNDEFFAILPTANEAIAHEVISRINTSLFTTTFFVNDHETISPVLSYGTASFGADGETSDLLMLAARLRKEQAKASTPRKVLWFPKEAIN